MPFLHILSMKKLYFAMLAGEKQPIN